MASRTCIGCRAVASDHELVRVTQRDGRPVLGLRGSGGRGAWLHPDSACVERARVRRAFTRALRTAVADGDFADMVIGWLADQGQS